MLDVYVEQLYAFGEPGRDPPGGVITVAYFAPNPPDAAQTPRAGADAAEAGWWSVYTKGTGAAFLFRRHLV